MKPARPQSFLPTAMRRCRWLLPVAGAAACSLAPDLPEHSPALRDMEEPLALRTEPDDEAARRQLAAGSFSGLYLRDARDTLAAKLDEPDAVEVTRIVENSPAATAGLQVADLVLEVAIDGGEPIPLRRPSQWRQIELQNKPGTKVELFVDRAGREAETELVLVQRVRVAEREAAERYREEERVGVVLRTATEVEARSTGLGPGGGAVIVGLSQKSPWRGAGLRFEDLIVAVDGEPLAHPQDLLAKLREADREVVHLDYVRAGIPYAADAALSDRAHTMSEVTLPLLFSYEADRGRSEWSFLLGIVNYRSTEAAWRFRLLWFLGFGGGDADELLESGS